MPDWTMLKSRLADFVLQEQNCSWIQGRAVVPMHKPKQGGQLATDDKFSACRRKNYVHSAYVEAAIFVNKSFGSDRAYWMLIRENVGQSVIERVLNAPSGPMRQKQRQHAAARPRSYALEYLYLADDPRVDRLTSQRVEVALVFQAMLGNDAATEYLRNASVPIWIIARVLGSTRRRASPELVEA